jgi:hypothetical protein
VDGVALGLAAGSGGGGDERVERGGGQHLGGRVGEVEGHEGRAVGLVEVEALDGYAVGVELDLVLLGGVSDRCEMGWNGGLEHTLNFSVAL